MLRRRSLRALVLVGLSGLVALTVGAAPDTSAAGLPTAVTGGITQAFAATPYVKPSTASIPSARFYLAGTGFGKTAPNGSTDETQSTNVLTSSGDASDPSSAFWTGAYSGTIKGKVTISWWWSTHDPLAGNGNLIAHLYADPGTPQAKEIGSATTGVTNADGGAHQYTVVIDADGVVGSKLQLLGEPVYADGSQDLTVHYGSATAPSYLEIPLGSAPPAKLPTTTSVKDKAPLVVSATKIGRKAAEPTLGVTKAGNAFMAAGDFDGLSPANPRTLIYSSSDGNKTWHNVSPLVAGQPIPPATLDPYLYVDPDTGRIFNDDLTVACSFLQWSDDEGKTWAAGDPLACESPVDDHQTVVTGKPIAGLTTTGYPKIVYYCVNKVAGVGCARSLNGGRTFTTTVALAFQGYEFGGGEGEPSGLCGGLHGHIVTDPDGRLLLPKGHCGQAWLAISSDGGSSFKGVRVNKMAVASHQTSVASDAKGNLYYSWFGADDLLPYLSISRDHGETWGPALLIAPPGVAAVNYPTIDAQDPGHIAVSFPGTTQRVATDARPWNYYVMVSTNALAPRPVFHSTTIQAPSDPVHRGACLDRCAGMYDFIDVVIAPKGKALWAAAVDTCTTVKCIAAAGPTLRSGEDADDAQGIAIRQLSGAGLNGLPDSGVLTVPPVTGPGGVASRPGGLAATGAGATVPVIGLVAVLVALALRRRPVRA